ncbi:hypothetical protein [Dickeya oryzae]|uniref:hypothetical protein n=1 Tax=Dickeya oryzae TaxID=1240404 RepID=UPI001AECFDB9|nr:hypothetical protein [Dickeya oryzae]MBP2848363.1 hypothetical protein [Dickeya oryzae]
MLAAIKEIINPEVVINQDIDNNELILKEDGADSKISKLYITNIPSDSFAFTLDHQPGGSTNRWFKQLSPYVAAGNDKGINKGCDLIVLWHKDNAYTALVFDLKSDKPKVDATQKQLDNSELYLKYLLSMIAIHYGIATDSVVIKKAIVTTDNHTIRKRATYRPNAKPSQVGNYHIETVSPKAHKTGYISLQQLAR